eukprot:SAG11_NODE_39871_length_218_cov_343.899160_2_plen_47_part_01
MYPTRDSAQAERVREMEFGIGWMKMRRRQGSWPKRLRLIKDVGWPV